jgi:hypothetical protein
MAVLPPEQVPGSPPPPSNPLSGDGWNGGTPSSPSGPLPPKPGRRIAKKWWWVAGGGIIAIIAVAASAAGQKPATTANNQPTASAAATAAPTAAPTTAPTAAPTPPPAAPTLVRSGRGDGVVTVPAPYDTAAGLLTATHNGSANFIVEPLSADNTTGGALVNEIGQFKGTIPFDILQGQAASRLKVTADGAWTLTFADISTAPVATGVISGKGDSVILYIGPAATMHVTHNGVANFIVDEIPTAAGSQTNNLLNQIGQYVGDIPVEAGPALFAITADGAFVFTPS